MTGWQVNLGYLVTIQPVGTDEARKEALARWSALPALHRHGDRQPAGGHRSAVYSRPKRNVRIVIDQIDTSARRRPTIAVSLARRRATRRRRSRRRSTRSSAIRSTPAFRRYRDFLEQEYLPAARDDIAVAANPDGAALLRRGGPRATARCRSRPKEVHELGLREVDRLDGGDADDRRAVVPDLATCKALLERLRTDRQYMFKSREELIAYSQAALTRAKAAAPNWFGLLPKADVRIEPYPKFREKNAPNEYNAPAEDGSRSGALLHQRLPGREEEQGRHRVDGVSRDDSRPSPAERDRARAQGDSSDRPLHRQQRLRRRAGDSTPSGWPTR